MKNRVTRFKSLALSLKELEPFIRDGRHLQTGRPFKRFGGMRSREVLANWLICVVANFEREADRMTFTSDPTGSDGIIYDIEAETSWPTEHIAVSGRDGEHLQDVETRILDAIAKKRRKGGAAYASGKQLIVFLDAGGGTWFPNKVAKQLPNPLYFDGAWIVALQGVEIDQYVYGVTRLNIVLGNAPAWLVRIDNGFLAWTVQRIQ